MSRDSDFGLRDCFGLRTSDFGFLTMGATDILFYVFSALALFCGIMLLVSRNPVNSAMFLVLTIACLAGLFVLLQAFFLAAVQVLVYAGAVMVLFLFVIMLLELKEEERRRIRKFGAIAGLAAVGVIAFIFRRSLQDAGPVTANDESTAVGATEPLGRLL